MTILFIAGALLLAWFFFKQNGGVFHDPETPVGVFATNTDGALGPSKTRPADAFTRANKVELTRMGCGAWAFFTPRKKCGRRSSLAPEERSYGHSDLTDGGGIADNSRGGISGGGGSGGGKSGGGGASKSGGGGGK